MMKIVHWGTAGDKAIFCVQREDGEYKWLDASELNDLVVHLLSDTEMGPLKAPSH